MGRIETEGNRESERVSLRSIVTDPQFRSGYCDGLAGRPPRKLYYDPTAGDGYDTWGYERGRLLGIWLIATGQRPPKAREVSKLVLAYAEARDADIIR